MKTTKVCTAMMTACGGMLLSAGAAYAQDAQSLERVEITGSNIRRISSETASPVQTITRDDITKSGRTSVAELLQTLSVDNQGSVPKSFGNGFAAGASGLSLRGLGAASTLVLLNGRRIAPYGLADDGQKVFADLNVIPLDAVERVEILKDGGSAIYGSDAIAGVVNIILRKDYRGLAVNASYGQSRYSDGREKRVSLTGGFGDLSSQGFNVLANLEVGKQDPESYRERAGRGAVGRTDLRDLASPRSRASAEQERSRATTPQEPPSTATSATRPRWTITTEAIWPESASQEHFQAPLVPTSPAIRRATRGVDA